VPSVLFSELLPDTELPEDASSAIWIVSLG